MYRRLYLNKICLCCLLVIHLYSNNLPTITMIFSLIMSEFFPVCFFCSNIFNLSESSSGLNGENIVETQEAKIGCDFSIFISVRPRVDLLPIHPTSKCIFFAKSYINFLSAKLARSTL